MNNSYDSNFQEFYADGSDAQSFMFVCICIWVWVCVSGFYLFIGNMGESNPTFE